MKIRRFNEKSVLLTAVEKPYQWVEELHSVFPEISEIVPAFHEILLVFKSNISELSIIENTLKTVFGQPNVANQPPQLLIPVCFNRKFALDRERVATHTGSSFESIVAEMMETNFIVEFLGFLPGFPYMSGLAEKFSTPRLNSPRNQVGKGSVAIAENQCGIYPMTSPGGWNIIGNCPLNLFDLGRKEPSLFLPGDELRFKAISVSEHEELKQVTFTRKTLLI